MSKRCWILALAGVLLGALGASQEASFQLVVNAGNPVARLSKKEVSDLFLKRVTQWEQGMEVRPVDLTAETETRATFSEAVHGRSVSSVKSYWQTMIFSGRAVPPPEKRSDVEVVEYVRTNPGAIGYVSAAARTDGVRRLQVTE